MITVTSTSQSLSKLTLCLNSNSTGLNLASSMYTFLLEWFSLPTSVFNCLKDPIKLPNQIAAPPGPLAQPIQPQVPLPVLPVNQNPPVPQVDQPLPLPDLPPVAGPSGLQPQAHQHDLRPQKDLNYKEQHTGIKQRCRKLRRQGKAVVTRLAPGSFSQKKPPPDSPSQNTDNPGPSS